MDCKYPHWYSKECCPENSADENYPCCEAAPYMAAYPDATFKDRLLGMLGNKILFSVDARACGRETFCGSLCYVGCDYIIVNVCIRRKPISMYVPTHMIRFFALDQ